VSAFEKGTAANNHKPHHGPVTVVSQLGTDNRNSTV
jgi:hypothetical protein